MKLTRSLAVLCMSTALAGTGANAAEFFVNAITPGAVAGTALGVVTLQASEETASGATVPLATTEEVTTTAGKWVSARTTKTAGETTTPHTSGGTSSETTTTETAGTTTTGTTTTGTTTTSTATSGTSTTAVAPSTTAGVTVPPTAQLWPNFDTLMKSGLVKGGDRIVLLGGYHGQIVVRDQKFAAPVTILPAAGQVAHADSVIVMNSSNVQVQGLKVWARTANAGSGAVVRTYRDASNVAFTDLDVRAVADSPNYPQWSPTNWNDNRRSGFQVDGDRITVARNRVTGVFNGIIALGTNALIEQNIVDGISGDGMRALGDNSVVRRNRVQNCRQTSGAHNDGFQAWSTSATGQIGAGTLRNLVIEDNKFFESVGTRSAFNCKLQGISLFAGVYDGFVIRNNVVSSTAYHGITIAGGVNSQIVNNTVIHAAGLSGSFPWIRVALNRDGRPSQNMTVANNMVTALKVANDAAMNIRETNNIVVTSAAGEFASLATQDFSLKASSRGIDAGSATLAPMADILGAARPKGKGPDAGAYESY